MIAFLFVFAHVMFVLGLCGAIVVVLTAAALRYVYGRLRRFL